MFHSLAKTLSFRLWERDENLIDLASWFLANVTEKFDESQIGNLGESEIVPHIVVKMLYSDNLKVYQNALTCIINLTDVRSSSSADLFVSYDQSFNEQSAQLASAPALLQRLYSLIMTGMQESSSESYQTIVMVFSFLMNMLNSDDYNTKYLLSNDLLNYLVGVLQWNNPYSP